MSAWIGNRMAISSASRTSVGWSRCVRHAAHAVAHVISPTMTADVAVERMGLVQRPDDRVGVRADRDQHAVHQRPVGEHERGVLGRDVRAEQQQGVGRDRGERGEEREPLARAAALDLRRVERADRDVDEQPEERHRRREVRGHRLARVVEADGLATEPRLEADEQHRGDRRDEDRALVAMVLPGEERDAEDHEPDDRRDRAVDPLDPRLGVVERRDQLPVAQRPVGAAHAGIRRPDDHADRHEEARSSRPSRGRASGNGSRPAHSTWRRVRTSADTLTIMRRTPLLLALAASLLVAACGSPPRARPRPPSRRPASTQRLDRERHPGHRELAPGPGPQPVRVLVPRPEDQPPGRLAGPQGVGRVHRARPDPARTCHRGRVRVGDRGRARRLRGERGARRARRLQGGVHHGGARVPAGGDRRRLPGVRIVADGRDRRAGAGHGQPDDRVARARSTRCRRTPTRTRPSTSRP